jgi:hypothetical protein
LRLQRENNLLSYPLPRSTLPTGKDQAKKAEDVKLKKAFASQYADYLRKKEFEKKKKQEITKRNIAKWKEEKKKRDKEAAKKTHPAQIVRYSREPWKGAKKYARDQQKVSPGLTKKERKEAEEMWEEAEGLWGKREAFRKLKAREKGLKAREKPFETFFRTVKETELLADRLGIPDVEANRFKQAVKKGVLTESDVQPILNKYVNDEGEFDLAKISRSDYMKLFASYGGKGWRTMMEKRFESYTTKRKNLRFKRPQSQDYLLDVLRKKRNIKSEKDVAEQVSNRFPVASNRKRIESGRRTRRSSTR